MVIRTGGGGLAGPEGDAAFEFCAGGGSGGWGTTGETPVAGPPIGGRVAGGGVGARFCCGGGTALAELSATRIWLLTLLVPVVLLATVMACNAASELDTSPLSVTTPFATATLILAARVVSFDANFA